MRHKKISIADFVRATEEMENSKKPAENSRNQIFDAIWNIINGYIPIELEDEIEISPMVDDILKRFDVTPKNISAE